MAKKKEWVFTKKRREALKKAQKEHVALVSLGLRVRGRGAKAKFAKAG